MNTKKLFMLLAAMLLNSLGAFAQSGNNDPMKGDVNEDGSVDVADIAAVIKIMKDGGGTAGEKTYYWYAGQTQPSSMTSNPTVDDENFTNNKWHTLNANQINQTITGGTAGNSWYVAVPTSKGFNAYASDLITPETSWDKINTITINNISYDLWQPSSTGAKLNVYMTVTPTQQQTYYYYFGTEKLTSDAEIKGKNMTISGPTDPAISSLTIPSDSYVYFYYPASFGTATIKDEGNDNAGGKDVSALSDVSLTNYKGWRFNTNNSGLIYTVTFTEALSTYYFSIGTTAPTSSNYTTVNDATTIIPTSQEWTNTGSKSSIYVLAPDNKTVTIKDTNTNILFTDVYEDTSISIPNHKVWSKTSKVGNGGSITVILSL